MANPQISGGVLNRAKASVTLPSFPALNVTIPYLDRDGISITVDRDLTSGIETAASMVQSPEIWVPVSVRIGLLKSQPLSGQWKAQAELNTLLGDMTVRADSSAHPPYDLTNCSIQRIEPSAFNGASASWVVMLRGTWYVNTSLFD